MDLSTVRLADFAGWIGTEFRVVTEPNTSTVLELIAAEPLSLKGNLPRPDPFSVIFGGPTDQPLDQRIHTLEHAQLGRLGLFLVPIGPGPDGQRRNYQSIFS